MRRSLTSILATLCLALPLAACGAGEDTQDESWSGTWSTSYGRMVLHQDGSDVTGTYTFCDGTVDATADGDRLTGTWRQRHGCDGTDMPSGSFDFQLEADGESFDGDWRYAAEGPSGDGGPWSGRLLTARSDQE